MASDMNMTPCGFAQDAPSYLLGELSRGDASAFERHLETCPECAERVAEFRKIADELKSVPYVALVRDLAPLVLDRLGEDAWKASKPAFRPRRRVAFELAAAAAILVAVGLAFRFLYPVPSSNTAVAGSPVPSALSWLSKAQHASGAWKPGDFGGSDSQSLGVTSLALYSFLKHPDLTRERYKEIVRRGVRFVVQHQRADGSIGAGVTGVSTRDHGLATLALVRASAVLGDARTRKAADAALANICRAQSPDGSWGHSQSGPRTVDTSVTVWQLHALIEARSSGWKGLETHIDRGLAWLKQARIAEGRLAYGRAGSFPYGNTPATDAGRLFLLADALGGSEAARRLPTDDPLRTYFVTRGLEALDDANAERWVRTLRDALANRQVKTGRQAGSWDASDPAGGRVSSTALAALTFN